MRGHSPHHPGICGSLLQSTLRRAEVSWGVFFPTGCHKAEQLAGAAAVQLCRHHLKRSAGLPCSHLLGPLPLCSLAARYCSVSLTSCLGKSHVADVVTALIMWMITHIHTRMHVYTPCCPLLQYVTHLLPWQYHVLDHCRTGIVMCMITHIHTCMHVCTCCIPCIQACHAYTIHVNVPMATCAEVLMALLKSTMVVCFPAMCIVGGLVLAKMPDST